MPTQLSNLSVLRRAVLALFLVLSLCALLLRGAHPAGAATQGDAIAAAAASQAGVPYCDYGGNINGPTNGGVVETGCGPGVAGFDCMSLSQYAVYQVTGIVLPSDGSQLSGVGTVIPPSDMTDLLPGDVTYWGGTLDHFTHSGIYAGNGEIWDAVSAGIPVQLHTFAYLEQIYTYDGAIRYGNAGSISPPPISPLFTSDSPPGTATITAAYSYTFVATGTPVPSFAVTSGSLPAGISLDATTGLLSGTPTAAGTSTFTVTASNGTLPDAISPMLTIDVTAGGAPSPPPTPPAPTGNHGYWLVGSDGGIFSFGSAQFYGSTGSLNLQRPVVGVTPTGDRGGYWLVASDGGIFSFGNAGYFGSIPGLGIAPAGTPGAANRLNAPVVGMFPSSDGGGYFMVASDGGVFAFGDAKFEGSCPGIGGCSGPAVAVMPDASGNGYWLVTATGHVYTFGDASYYGAPGPQSTPVTSAVRTADGKGYWILFATGTVDAYGDATNLGAPVGQTGGSNPASSIFATSDGGGYWVASASGAVYNYGDAPNDGGMAAQQLNGAIIAATGF